MVKISSGSLAVPRGHSSIRRGLGDGHLPHVLHVRVLLPTARGDGRGLLARQVPDDPPPELRLRCGSDVTVGELGAASAPPSQVIKVIGSLIGVRESRISLFVSEFPRLCFLGRTNGQLTSLADSNRDALPRNASVSLAQG
jgi:hypothetical protein